MIKDLLKWVAPGAVTILGGTAAAVAMSSPAVLGTIEQEGRDALGVPELSWAHLANDGRHFILSGTTDSETNLALAMARVSSVPGIAAVDPSVTVAPLAKPYRLQVLVEDGAVKVLGNVPNAELEQRLGRLPGIQVADLSIRAGQPDETLWANAAEFLVAQAAQIGTGTLTLSDLTLNADATAKTARGFGYLEQALTSLPDGLHPGKIVVHPAAASPYEWHAIFDGKRIAISGYAPDEASVERWRTADVSGVPIATGLALASGAPRNFEQTTALLIRQLSQLQSGEASIVDGTVKLDGVPPSYEVAQAVTNAMSGTGSIVTLAPPPVSDYWVSVTRQPGGVLVFDGYVPDEATRTAFSEVANADTSYLKFGSGAPTGFRASVEFGLRLLGEMSEGRIALRGNALSVSGIAATPAAYKSIMTKLDADRPQSVEVGQVELQAPSAKQYDFTAERSADGKVRLTGMMPSVEVQKQLLAVVGPDATADATFASGQPDDFLASASQALGFLRWLKAGSVHFDGTSWTISGQPNSAIDQGSIESEFAVRKLAQAGWQLQLSPAPAVEAASAPYTWSAEKLADGRFTVTGQVPAKSLQSYLAVHLKSVDDQSKITEGAPEGFANAVRSATDILLTLETGVVAFDGTAWTVEGDVADDATQKSATDAAATQLAAEASIVVKAALATAEAPAASTPIAVAPATEPAAVAPAAAPASQAGTGDVALCRQELTDLSGRNAILFQSGAAIIADGAESELDGFAATLAKCPGALINVEGHTDSDGDHQRNLALSVARAEAVVNALVQRGVSPDRLYAVGYGDSRPIADNATQDGKRSNRRIVVTVRDGGEN